jgi:hypothetical protein
LQHSLFGRSELLLAGASSSAPAAPGRLLQPREAVAQRQLDSGPVNVNDAVPETVSWRANRVTSPWRPVGGRLAITGRRLRFEPHAVDRAVAATGWSVNLDEVSAVDIAPRRPFSHLFGAGFRRQLRITEGDQTAYFVVNSVAEVAAVLRALTEQPAS